MMKKTANIKHRFFSVLTIIMTLMLFVTIHHTFMQNRQTPSKGISATISIQNSDAILSTAYVLPQFNENSLVSKIVPSGSLPGNLEFSILIENFFHNEYAANQFELLTFKQGHAWMYAYLHIISSQGDDSPLIS